MKGEKHRVIVPPEIIAQQPLAQQMMDKWGYVIVEEFAKPGDPRSIGTRRDAQRLFAELSAPAYLRQIERDAAQ